MKSLLTAWLLLTGRLPAPASSLPRSAFALVPVVGFLHGACAYLIALGLVLATGGRLSAAGLLSAIAIPGALWITARGAGPTGVIWAVERWAERAPQDEVGGRYTAYWAMLAFQVTILAKVVATGAVVYLDALLWVGLVPVLSASVYVELLGGAGNTGENGDSQFRYLHWVTSAAIVLLVTGLTGELIAGGLVLLVVLLLTPSLARLIQTRCGSLTERGCRVCMELTETVVLLLGILFTVGFRQG